LLHGPAQPGAGSKRRLDPVAAREKAIGLALKAALDADPAVDPRCVDVEAQ